MTLQEKKRYKIEKDDFWMEFYPMTIDRAKNELYIKVVKPFSAHTGLVLSSVEGNNDVLITQVQEK